MNDHKKTKGGAFRFFAFNRDHGRWESFTDEDRARAYAQSIGAGLYSGRINRQGFFEIGDLICWPRPQRKNGDLNLELLGV